MFLQIRNPSTLQIQDDQQLYTVLHDSSCEKRILKNPGLESQNSTDTEDLTTPLPEEISGDSNSTI